LFIRLTKSVAASSIRAISAKTTTLSPVHSAREGEYSHAFERLHVHTGAPDLDPRRKVLMRDHRLFHH
jgi:hypothetical protein